MSPTAREAMKGLEHRETLLLDNVGFRKILVPVVPQPHTEQALSIAMLSVEFAVNCGSKPTFLYVTDSKQIP